MTVEGVGPTFLAVYPGGDAIVLAAVDIIRPAYDPSGSHRKSMIQQKSINGNELPEFGKI
jgi:hypothetical protein